MAGKQTGETDGKSVVKVSQGGTLAEYDYSEYSGMSDAVDKNDLIIPFLSILQPMSPVVVDGEVPGAKAGSYYNTVTGDLYEGEGKGVNFQLVHHERVFVEWVPRESGGGIAGRYSPDDPLVVKEIERNKGSVVGIKLDNGNDLIETYYAYGNILSEDASSVEGFAVLPIKSNNIKPFKGLVTALSMIKGRPPRFVFKVVLKTTKEKNEKGTWYQLKAYPFGQDWKSSRIDPETERPMLQAAADLLEMVRSGAAKADYANEGKVSSDGNTGDGDGDVPF